MTILQLNLSFWYRKEKIPMVCIKQFFNIEKIKYHCEDQ